VDGGVRVSLVAGRSDTLTGRGDTVSGRTVNVTELEWSGEVVAYAVVHRGMIWRERSITVGTHVHDTTKQDQFPHYIVYGRSENLANPTVSEPSTVVAHRTGSADSCFFCQSLTFSHDLLERAWSVQNVGERRPERVCVTGPLPFKFQLKVTHISVIHLK
jgi:hypothetical protein